MKLKSIIGASALGLYVVGTAALTINLHNAHKTCNETYYLQQNSIRCLTEKVDEQQKLIDELQQTVNEQKILIDAVPQSTCVVYESIPLSKELQEFTYEQCIENGCVDYYELVLAVMWQESNFNPYAVSSTNDYGIMQINRINHSRLSSKLGITNFLDAKQNIRGGVYLLSNLIHKYGQEHQVLMAYNMGEAGAASKWNNGIYTSTYSNNIIDKKNKIKNAK